MGGPVSLVKAKSPDEIEGAISRALDLISFSPKRSVKTVVIKPNLCFYWGPSTGYTTDPAVVSGLINILRRRYGVDLEIKVAEADATAMRTNHAFQMLGYNKLAKESGVELINLSESALEEREVTIGNNDLSFLIPKLLLDVDILINVPKLKIMRETTITCAFKNLFGAIGYRRKIEYHSKLEEAIVGITKVLNPDLTLVDGLVGLGRLPVKLNLLMASKDSFSIDWVAAKVMGYNPKKIEYLRIAMKEMIGNPNGITILGNDIEPFRESFPGADSAISKLKWSLLLNLLKLYNKLVKDTLPGELEEA